MTSARHLRIVVGTDGDAPPDAVLVAQAASGDRNAFEQLYRRHVALVFTLAKRLLRDASEAEDVAQETFEIVLQKIGTLRDPAALQSWIVRIAVRQVRQRFRKQQLLKARYAQRFTRPQCGKRCKSRASRGARTPRLRAVPAR
jgi:RNA polymerase sigma factor (sigma-70 family)